MALPQVDSGVPSLSLTRIHRLLRPLRTRCASLATLGRETRRRPATYSSKASQSASLTKDSGVSGTLALPPPGTLGASEVSRKVYAVRDCFRDVLLATGRGSTKQIPSLAQLCSAAVGDRLDDEEARTIEEKEAASEYADDIYAAVPVEYRGWTVVSHALRIILDSNSHQCALLNVLLDVTLEHRLIHESKILLHYLLSSALGVEEDSRVEPPICYSAQSTFLQDLRTRWNAACLADITFFDIFLDTIQNVRNPGVWCSKTVRNLARTMCSRDFGSYMRFLGSFAELAGSTFNRPAPDGTNGRSEELVQLWRCFHKWVTIALDRLLSVPAENSCVEWEDRIEITHSLVSMLRLGLHRAELHKNSLESLRSEISEIVLCLATWWLSTRMDVGGSDLSTLVSRLEEVLPRPSTYVPLVEKIFLESSLEVCREKFRSLTSLLRGRGLARLETSMWACILRQIEQSSCESLLKTRNSAEEIQKYRHELIQRVEESENRCFGIQTMVTPKPTRIMRTPVCSWAKSIGKRSVWRWESLLGCWIRKGEEEPTPAQKKRKVEGRVPKRRDRASEPAVTGRAIGGVRRLARLSVGSDSEDREGNWIQFGSLLSHAIQNRANVHTVCQSDIRGTSDDLDLFAYRNE